MQKAGKFWILVLLVCLCVIYVPGIESQAGDVSGERTSADSGLEDENPQRLEEVTGMDKNGNIFEMDETEGEVSVPEIVALSDEPSVKIVNFGTKGNAVTNYTEYSTGAAGYTNGAYGADAAYLGTKDGKVRFMLSGVVGEVKEEEVQVVDFSNVASVSCYKAEGGRLLHYITQDMTAAKHATSLDNGGAPSYLQGGVTYYSYDGHYFYTEYGTMLEDYKNGTRSGSVNPGDPYYNYYQYLPFRSRTSYSGTELNGLISGKAGSSSKLNGTGDCFAENQNTYGVNALIMVGIAANESGWGTSSICVNKNNLFGLNAVDSSPGTSANTYASAEECIRQFADGWMSRGYLNPNDGRYKGGFLGNKASGVNVSYASDPYWGEKAANLLWRLDQNGGGRDANVYTIGIKGTLSTDHINVNIRSGSSESSDILYKTGSHSGYAVLLQDPAAENSYYRIQSDAVLKNDRSSVDTGTGKYDYDQMYAYTTTKYVTIVNQGSTISVPEPKTLQSIRISQAPARTEYMAGESFDASGMGVAAVWSDGTESDVTAEAAYSTDALQAGTGSITVSYTYEGITVTAEQAVTVQEQPQLPENTPLSDDTQSPENTPPSDDTPPADEGETGAQPSDLIQAPGIQPDSLQVSEGDSSQQQAEPPAGNTDGKPQFQPVTDGGKTTEQDGSAQASPETTAEQNDEAQSGSDNTAEQNDTVQPDAGDKPGSQKVPSAADKTGKDTKAPKTGDENNLLLWSILLVISASRMTGFFRKKVRA